jgi:N12 class adenine-specific DNA methylase
MTQLLTDEEVFGPDMAAKINGRAAPPAAQANSGERLYTDDEVFGPEMAAKINGRPIPNRPKLPPAGVGVLKQAPADPRRLYSDQEVGIFGKGQLPAKEDRFLYRVSEILEERPDLAGHTGVNWSEAVAQHEARRLTPGYDRLPAADRDRIADRFRSYYGAQTSTEAFWQLLEHTKHGNMSQDVGRAGTAFNAVRNAAGNMIVGPVASGMDIGHGIARKIDEAVTGRKPPPFQSLRKMVQDNFAQAFPLDPKHRESLAYSLLPSGATSMTLFALAALRGGVPAVTGLGTALGLDEGWATVASTENDLKLRQSLLIIGGHGVLGAGEAIPFVGFLQRLGGRGMKSAVGRAVSARLAMANPVVQRGVRVGYNTVAQAFEEAAQEYGQEFYGELIDYLGGATDHRSWADAVIAGGEKGRTAATVGGILGGLMGAGGGTYVELARARQAGEIERRDIDAYLAQRFRQNPAGQGHHIEYASSDAFIGATATPIDKSILLTPQGAWEWAKNHPAAAQTLAEIENPSRADFKDALGGTHYFNAEERAQFAATLRQQEAEVAEIADVADAAGAEAVDAETAVAPAAAPAAVPVVVAEGQIDFETSFPQPEPAAIEAGVVQEMDTPEAVAALHQDQKNQMLALLDAARVWEQARERGVDPDTGKPPRGKKRTAELERLYTEAPATLAREYDTALVSYQDVFGPDAAVEFDAYLKETFDREVAELDALTAEPAIAEPAITDALPSTSEPASTIDIDAMSEESLAAWIEQQGAVEASAAVADPSIEAEAGSGQPGPADRREHSAPKAPATSAPSLSDKAAAARVEFTDSLKELGDYLDGIAFSLPISDPKLLGLTAKVTAKAIKAGAYTFADMVGQVAQHFGKDRAKKLAPALEWAWTKLHQADQSGRLSPVGNAAKIIEELSDEPARRDNQNDVGSGRDGNPKPAGAAKPPAGRDSSDGVSGGEGTGSQSGQPGRGGAGKSGSGGSSVGGAGSVGKPEPAAAPSPAGSGQQGGGKTQGADGGPQQRSDSDRSDLRPEDKNHVIERDSDVAPRGDVSKYRANLSAIKLLRSLESESRNPTSAEKNQLASYTGWGWAKEYFNPDNAKYASQHADLKKLLSPEEFKSAAASTLNAHYTSPEVIAPMWDAVKRLGFKGGVVLEPAMGVGHFLGMAPPGTTAIGVELDSISARIAKKLYPESDIRHQGFEEARIADNSVDLAISNVPFGDYSLGAKDYPKLLIHDYFFARGLDKVKPGGLVAFITSDGTLNKLDTRTRVLLSQKADMVGAIRLPNDAFKGNAGTEVTTDIIFMRKKDGMPFEQAQPFIRAVQVGEVRINKPDGGTELKPVWVNEYFAANPDMALGEHTLAGTMYSKDDYALVSRPGQDTPALLREAIRRLPENVMGSRTPQQQNAGMKSDAGEAAASEQDGGYVEKNGEFYQVRDGRLVEPDWYTQRGYGSKEDVIVKPISPDILKRRKKIVRDWLAVRNAARTLFDAENTPGMSDAKLSDLRVRLNSAYDAYAKKWGTLTRRKQSEFIASFMEDDLDYPLVQALEDNRDYTDPKTGKEVEHRVKSDAFSKRLREPKSPPDHVDSIADAVAVNLAYHNTVSPDYVASLMGISPEQARSELLESGRVLVNPETGLFEIREKYLSGNVRKKLAIAEEAVKSNPVYQVNVESLKSIQPKDVTLNEVTFSLSSRWIPEEAYSAFLRDVLHTGGSVKYIAAANRHVVEVDSRQTPQIQTTYGTQDRDAVDLLEMALAGKDPLIKRTSYDSAGNKIEVVDAEATEAARQQLAKLKRDFVSWAKTATTTVTVGGESMLIRESMERRYNEVNNAIVAPKYSGDYLVLPGLSDVVRRTPHQLAAVARILQEGFGLIAHGVGFGKTYTQIIAAMEARRLGIAKKPMIVVQKATVGQFAASFKAAYPDARIIVATEKTFAEKNRKRLMARIAMGNYDAVIVTQPQYEHLASKPDNIKSFFAAQLDELEAAIRASKKAGGGKNPTTRELEGAKKRLEAKLKTAMEYAASRQDDGMYFEDLGIDMLFVDEAHAYKRIPLVTQMSRIKGIPNDSSGRAITTQIKVGHIQQMNEGRNVVFATGTPVTNTMAEVYVMLNYVAPHVLGEYGITNFDAFASTFGEMREGMEFSWSGKWRWVQRFNKFTNGPELVTMIRSAFDVELESDKLDLNVPKIRNGKPTMVTVDQNQPTEVVTNWLLDIADAFERSSDKREISWVPITVMQAGMAAALDPRLIDPSLPDHPGSKINQAVQNIAEIWQRDQHRRGTQIVFLDRFAPMNTAKLEGFLSKGEVTIDIDESLDGDADSDPDTDSKKQAAAESAAYKAGGFNLYKDIKAKLVASGIPEAEVAIIHDFDTDKAREQLFARVNAGHVRVILGSTEKLGVGVNVQKRLTAAHFLDPPRMMNPAMHAQRMGRIIRQGNAFADPNSAEHDPNFAVDLVLYGTKQSLDTGIYQMLEANPHFSPQLCLGVCWMSRLVRLIRARGSRGS